MEYWLPIVFEHDVTQFPALARKAEEVGFTGIAVPDHVVIPSQRDSSEYVSGGDPFEVSYDFFEPFSAITAMAMSTTDLRFMTFVYVLGMREPFSVAKAAATVSDLSGGRFALGCASGWLKEEIALMGHDPRTRGRRTDEMIDIVKGFWREGTFEYHGEHYDFGPATMLPKPAVEPPVWIGGGRAALPRAVRNDGWVAMEHDPDVLCDILDELTELRRRQADEHGAPDRPQQTLVVPRADAQRRALRPGRRARRERLLRPPVADGRPRVRLARRQAEVDGGLGRHVHPPLTGGGSSPVALARRAQRAAHPGSGRSSANRRPATAQQVGARADPDEAVVASTTGRWSTPSSIMR